MKIKNEQIMLKIGDKKYEFQNLILDEYLKRFARRQQDKDQLNLLKNKTELKCCLLKFDTPLENLSETSQLANEDFDICLDVLAFTQQISQRQTSITYNYDSSWVMYDYNKSGKLDIKDYYGKQITAIGFNSTYLRNSIAEDVYVCAVLDTSNYNIYLQKNQDLAITRKDVIETDAIFSSNNIKKVPGPVHLAPYGLPLTEQPTWYNDVGYGILYSVGLSTYNDYIDKEFIVGQDVSLETVDNGVKIKGIENYLNTEKAIFCDINLYPGNNIFPMQTNYKYIILKYKVWQTIVADTINTGHFYYMAIPINKFGKSDLIIEYERG